MAEITYQLRLLKLHCYRQEESDGDEVFIKYKKEKIWPLKSKYESMKEGSLDVNVDIAGLESGTEVEIELWDYDLLTPNDKLGTFKMLVNEKGGPFKTDLLVELGEDAKYSLEWEAY
ncbi:hypothetical protein [Fulvivirga lutea]|uniref:Uncharacterized protein n=1 Tax=Fulvivirga lutea TaxID=2810512 RepID=A0A974WDL5_9BACT|nr:hypothetical protein [Fulvivirga lutea]QSE96149.1 hypothetical protein JR347_11045 [Fulvivirga lutea]